ncbi:prostaglandin E2 receptor EP4 subtype-like [Mya arenaria]|uniref:prostaglandin E2 receptor EP4 subtype-like n=1 Tax=Mya arenaria TaxID=6604 RepID=UPI0022E0A339|nr:prostaglandin E2 receptor EP4 subtype-like [Mya arenaria]
MTEIRSVMENMTRGPTALFDLPEMGLIETDDQNTTEALVVISSVKKHNSVVSSSIMFSFGVFGNLLALIVLQRSPSDQKRKLFYRLVAGLTLNDLFGTVCLSPFVIATYVNDFKWIGGTLSCKYFGFMMVFAGVATSTIVCLMAIERLLCIRHPYLYYARLRKKHATIFLIGAWAFAGLIASLPLMGFGEIVLKYPYTWCFINYYTNNDVSRAYNYLFALLELVTITITVSCNGIVLYTLFQTKMRGLSRKRSGDSRTFSGYSRRYAEFQMAVLLIGITIVFSSCYLPLIIRIVINQTKLLPVNLRLDLLIIRFASLNQILDPWVYILLRREVVWKVGHTIKTVFFRNSTDKSSGNFRRQESVVFSMNEGNQTCCSFCYHCLCDPPQSQRQASVCSFYGEERSFVLRAGAANILAADVAKKFILSNGNSGLSRKVGIAKLQRQASVDVELSSEHSSNEDIVCVQPSETRLKIFANGEIKSSLVESSKLSETLLSESECGECSDEDGV